MKKLVYSFILTTAALLFAVVLFQWCKQFFQGVTVTINADYSYKTMIAGLVADAFRGLLLAILYSKTTSYNTSYKTAISFGIITSLIAGTLSILYPFMVGNTNGLPFLLEETTILLLQGLFSGIALGLVYIPRRKPI
jgi:glucan phosphoethanolaminetransferase (alkaline phosphatase superfamily)